MDAVTTSAMPEPTADELAMYRHVSWAGAVSMYALRTGLDVKAHLDAIKRVFIAAMGVSHV